jgi:hypothetical protein
MIKFEINEFPFALTNDQMVRIYTLIAEYGWDLDYDVVEGDTNGIVWLWVHHEDGNPTRCWIETDGIISLSEDVDWDWQGVGTPTPQRFDLTALYPQRDGEDNGAWTNRVLSHAKEHGTNRQCSIGWHGECSDPAGEQCMCLCHADGVDTYSVEGDAEGGTITVLRSELGKHRWPPQPGESATMWAEWILGFGADDASERAIKKQEARK